MILNCDDSLLPHKSHGCTLCRLISCSHLKKYASLFALVGGVWCSSSVCHQTANKSRNMRQEKVCSSSPPLFQVQRRSASPWSWPASMAASQMSTPRPWRRTWALRWRWTVRAPGWATTPSWASWWRTWARSPAGPLCTARWLSCTTLECWGAPSKRSRCLWSFWPMRVGFHPRYCTTAIHQSL